MPYKDREQNREYQANWQRKTKRNRPKVNRQTIFSLVDLKTVPKPSGGRMTWEELTRVKLVKENTYSACVKEAKRLAHMRKCDRLTIARIALQACTIKHGGKLLEGKLSLKEFSKDIGVVHKTLHEWIRITRFALCELPAGQTTLNWSNAMNALRAANKTGKSVKELYLEYETNPGRRGFSDLLVRLRSALYSVKKWKSEFTKQELAQCLAVVLQIRDELS